MANWIEKEDSSGAGRRLEHATSITLCGSFRKIRAPEAAQKHREANCLDPSSVTIKRNLVLTSGLEQLMERQLVK